MAEQTSAIVCLYDPDARQLNAGNNRVHGLDFPS